MTYEESTKAYSNYIDEHRANVEAVWRHLEPLCIDIYWLDDCSRVTLDCLIKNHDMSKYSEDEFYGYQQFFYTADDQVKSKESFKYAWNHHQKHNRHHWEYWVMVDGTVLPMTGVYLLEMLCDWGAMSLKFGDLPSEFYKQNQHNITLHGNTQRGVENWLPLIDRAVRAAKEARDE